jgi:hypothetical protein
LTLDGVMEDPGGAEGLERGGWAFKFGMGEEGATFKLDEVMESEALLLGRVVLGSGKRLFGAATGTKSLQLVDSKPAGEDGVVALTYRPA